MVGAALDDDALEAPVIITTQFPAGRMEAWGLHIHPLIQAAFTEAGAEYSLDLRDMCNVTFHAIEQGMRSLFENDLTSNQARVQKQLAPDLLKAELEESTTSARRSRQSAILEAMLNAHPIFKK